MTETSDDSTANHILHDGFPAVGLSYALPRGTTTFTVRHQDFEDWYPPGCATATLTR